MTTTTRRRARAVLSCAAILVFVGSWSTGVAEAAITSFDLAPTSGPPGTVVKVDGTACSPGLTVSATDDYVAIAAPGFQVSMQAPVAANGSWHASFKVPAGANAGASPVAALCVSDGLPSLTTVYTPQTFTVTAPPSTTTTTTTAPGSSTTPTTKKPPPGTSPPTHGGTPSTGDGNPGSTVPGSVVVPPPATSGNTGGGSTTGGSAKPSQRAIKADVSRAARAADLSAPELPASLVTGAGGLGWLAWLLLVALVVAAVGAPYWLRRSRRPQADDAAAAGDTA